MTSSAVTSFDPGTFRSAAPEILKPPEEKQTADIKIRFEQMLWAEMLSHAGLEKAFTQGGGEAASAFSRYVVESIAKDLAEKHPMGLAERVELDPKAASAQETPA